MSSPVSLPVATPAGVAESLFIGHHGWLLSRLQARLRDVHEASDVASETFVHVLRSLHAGRWQGVREPRAMLTTIAKRLLISHWRRRELELAYLSALAQQPEPTAPSPEALAIVVETLDYVAHALQGLPPVARRVFLLSQIDGLGYQAIASQLDISQSTVRRHMTEGFRRMALALARQDAGVPRPRARRSDTP